MNVIKVMDYGKIIDELSGVTHIQCFTDELNKEPIDMNGTDEKTGKEKPSFFRCNSSSPCF